MVGAGKTIHAKRQEPIGAVLQFGGQYTGVEPRGLTLRRVVAGVGVGGCNGLQAGLKVKGQLFRPLPEIQVAQGQFDFAPCPLARSDGPIDSEKSFGRRLQFVFDVEHSGGAHQRVHHGFNSVRDAVQNGQFTQALSRCRQLFWVKDVSRRHLKLMLERADVPPFRDLPQYTIIEAGFQNGELEGLPIHGHRCDFGFAMRRHGTALASRGNVQSQVGLPCGLASCGVNVQRKMFGHDAVPPFGLQAQSGLSPCPVKGV